MKISSLMSDNMKFNSNESYICEKLELKSLQDILLFPLYIQIETISNCNSRCIMCPRSKTKALRQNFIMTDALFEKLVNELQLYSNHLRRVIPQGYGEPLLDPKLPLRIKRLKDIGINQVYISTNASLLNSKIAQDILNSNLDQIDFSIDALTKETYNKIRIGLDYDEVVHNIIGFINLRNKTGTKTRIRFRYIIQSENAHEFDEFCIFWKKYLKENDSVSGKKLHTFGGNIDMPDSKEYQKLQNNLQNLPCKGIFGSMSILSDGNIPVCGVDLDQNFIAGNVNENKIRDIWSNGLFSEFREKHLRAGRSAYSHCLECNTWAPELKLQEI